MEIKAYELSFDLDFQKLDYSCTETIRVDSPPSSLSLDCLGLSISRVVLNGTEDLPFRVEEKNAKLVIDDIPEALKEVKISIDFLGKVSQNSLFGLYKSKYHGGYIVTTDLEPQGARTVFPCMDNPSFKSEFSVEITTDKDLKVISNMPASASEETVGGKRKTKFAKTPRMSTYLFYLGIGKFEFESKVDGNVKFLVATRPEQVRRAVFSLNSAVRFLRALEKYYAVPYPLPEMKLIAVPEYASGAMENWGAITFREVRLFVDENSSVENKRSAITVLGHELAHQWFGDLVTMRWWNDIWLNESFATFLEPKMTTMLYPDFDAYADFVKKDTTGAMESDSLLSTHPIDVTVNSPDEVAQIFDKISYGKGASVIRMMESFVGEEAFRLGVSNYLKEYSFGNAEGKDLWRHVEEVSKEPVSKMMESWVNRSGYPIIVVQKKEGKIALKQERFLLGGKNTQPELPWPIPLTFNLNGKIQKSFFDTKTEEIPILDSQLSKLKLNVGQTGFYRVLYDQELYELIGGDFGNLSHMDRWGILSDLFSFVLAGRVLLTQYLSFVGKCLQDNEYIVVDSLSDQLQTLRLIAPKNPEILGSYSSFHKSQGQRLGLEQMSGEKETDAVLRGKIFTRLALIDDPEYSEKLSALFEHYETLDPNLRTAAAIAYTRKSELNAFEPMVTMMKKIRSEADYIKIYAGLTSASSPELLRKTLDLCVSDEINRADSFYAIVSTGNNPDAGKVTWPWLTTNIERVKSIFPGTYVVSDIWERLNPYMGLGLEEELQEYSNNATLESAKTGYRKGLEMLQVFSKARARLQNPESR